jgi:hypothetical protein
MFMDNIPWCSCSWCVIKLHDRVVYVSEFMSEAGVIVGRDLRFVRYIRYGACRDRPRHVAWLDFIAPHRHLFVDVTVTIARKYSNILAVGAPLSLHFILVMVA